MRCVHTVNLYHFTCNEYKHKTDIFCFVNYWMSSSHHAFHIQDVRWIIMNSKYDDTQSFLLFHDCRLNAIHFSHASVKVKSILKSRHIWQLLGFSWQSGCFQYQRSSVQNPVISKFLFRKLVYSQQYIFNDEDIEKEAMDGQFSNLARWYRYLNLNIIYRQKHCAW